MMANAKFGMGCFWGPQDLFSKKEGVVSTTVGYTGGKQKNPTYTELGDHTETVEVEYDPRIVTYEELLDMFWDNHDPTYDTSKQYKSVIFYDNEEQKKTAEKSLKKVREKSDKKILTTLEPADRYYKAEEYHQNYYQKHKEKDPRSA